MSTARYENRFGIEPSFEKLLCSAGAREWPPRSGSRRVIRFLLGGVPQCHRDETQFTETANRRARKEVPLDCDTCIASRFSLRPAFSNGALEGNRKIWIARKGERRRAKGERRGKAASKRGAFALRRS